MTRLTTLGFDADDTLWQHERFFQLTQQKFGEILRPYADPHHLAEHLLAAERRNVKHYGFGVKGFMLSLIETAVDVTDGRVPGKVIGEVLEAGRELLRHPIEPMPHVAETLRALGASHQLILITKGDLFDQERKLAASGLGDHFEAVEVVSDKSAAVYDRLFRRHGSGPEAAMMVGNSLASDIVPALAVGAWGVHVPSGFNWELGPFQMWDAAGVAETAEKLRAQGRSLPSALEKLLETKEKSWYRDSGAEYFDPRSGEYVPVEPPSAVMTLSRAKRSGGLVAENPGASLFDVGDGVACIEFHTKMNALGGDIVSFVRQNLAPDADPVRNFRAFVITNDAANFSAGANRVQLLLSALDEE
mgnify:CR=1 FL=1